MTPFDIEPFIERESWEEHPDKGRDLDTPWFRRKLLRRPDGRCAIFKHYPATWNALQGGYEFLNHLLLRACRIATPDLRLHRHAGHLGVLSFFPPESMDEECDTWFDLPTDVDVDTFFENPRDLRSIAVYDFWVGNVDRSVFNSIHCRRDDVAPYKWYAIDTATTFDAVHDWNVDSSFTDMAEFYRVQVDGTWRPGFERPPGYHRLLRSPDQAESCISSILAIERGYIDGAATALHLAGYFRSEDLPRVRKALDTLFERRVTLRDQVRSFLASKGPAS